MISYVYKPKRVRNGKPRVGKSYRGRYQLDGETGKPHDVPLRTRDRQVAEHRLHELVRDLQREALGIVPPKPLREAAVRPLSEHLPDFLADLTAKGRDAKYVYNVRKRVERLLSECRWTLPRDVTTDGFQAWRAAQDGKAAKTLNEYLDAANALFNWMLRHGRLAANPLRSAGKVESAAARCASGGRSPTRRCGACWRPPARARPPT